MCRGVCFSGGKRGCAWSKSSEAASIIYRMNDVSLVDGKCSGLRHFNEVFWRDAMRSYVWLRTVSVMAVVHGLLHTINVLFGSAPAGPAQQALDAMKANHFDAFGSTRSFWDFFLGYGLILTVTMAVQAVVFWQLAAMSKRDPRVGRPLIMTFAIGLIASAAVAGRYFFWAPMVFEFGMAAVLLCAWLAAGRERPPADVSI